MDKMKIREVIVVEGKDDTKRINMAVNADTLETRGSAISDETLDQIEELQEKRGVIVFTDPDFSGEKIRKIIQEAVPGVKHAFLNRRDAVPDHKGSLGVDTPLRKRFEKHCAIFIPKNPMLKRRLQDRICFRQV